MSHPKSDVGKPCIICKREIHLHEFRDMEAYTSCSDFCDSTSPKEKVAFLNARPGEWIEAYPCPECGRAIEGEWSPDEPKKMLCSECAPKVRLRERTELLKKARDFLVLHAAWSSELVKEIDDALKE